MRSNYFQATGLLCGVALSGVLAACSGDSKKTNEPEPEQTSTAKKTTNTNYVGVEAEIGALDEDAVGRTFSGLSGAMTACVEDAQERVPYLFGDAVIYVRVLKDGRPRYVFFEESTLGDRQTEMCILNAVQSKTWPVPQGGKEGYARLPFNLKGRGGVRSPVPWSAQDAGKGVNEARTAIGKCVSDAGASAVRVTVHVATDGSVISVGVSGKDESSERVAGCVVSAVRGLKFNSPGSYAAKLTIE